jgi:hypothetical protein
MEQGKSSGPEIFTPDNAESYGRWLGERYRSRPIIWVLGGDRDIQSDRHKAIIRAMAKGIAIGVSGREDYSQVLMTFHPRGGRSSAQWFHDDPWLDFNMQQNGHCNDADVAGRIARDYARHPVKPVLDGEPLYENFSMCFSADRPLSDAYEVRKYAYWSVLSGAFGHAYGNHSVWQMADDRHPPVNGPQQLRHRVANRVLRTAGSPMRVSASLLPWREALHQDGARDMQHLRRLVESRPFTDRVPDGSLVAGSLLTGSERIVAIRDAARSYAFVYSAGGRPVSVHLGRIGGPVRAWWFSPRTGEAHAIGTFPNAGVQAFTPQSQGRGNDWVLVLDDVSKGYGTPGRPR